jgi:hypothetical protein
MAQMMSSPVIVLLAPLDGLAGDEADELRHVALDQLLGVVRDLGLGREHGASRGPRINMSCSRIGSFGSSCFHGNGGLVDRQGIGRNGFRTLGNHQRRLGCRCFHGNGGLVDCQGVGRNEFRTLGNHGHWSGL